VTGNGAQSEPTVALPKVFADGQGGLLDVALDPKHAENSLVYLSYAEPRSGGNGTTVARGRLAADAKPPRLEDVRVIWRQQPTLDSDKHFGSRLVFGRDGTLFVTTGERYIDAGRAQALRLDSALGKVIGDGKTQAPGMEQPAYYWDPVIAPSGMAFYTGTAFPAWRGSLFVGGLVSKHVARLSLDGVRGIGEERLLEGRARFRDVRVGPDGMLYLLTDEDDGEILRLVPRR
jgi:glucose/arabinose dehydrogenase